MIRWNQNLAEFLLAPGPKHLFGTDQLGRDLFTRTLYAARTDLWIMVMAEIAPFIIGIFLEWQQDILEVRLTGW